MVINPFSQGFVPVIRISNMGTMLGIGWGHVFMQSNGLNPIGYDIVVI